MSSCPLCQGVGVYLSVSLMLCWPVCLCFHLPPSIHLEACPTNYQGESILHSSCLSLFLWLFVLFTLSPRQPLCHFISVSLCPFISLSIFLLEMGWTLGIAVIPPDGLHLQVFTFLSPSFSFQFIQAVSKNVSSAISLSPNCSVIR